MRRNTTARAAANRQADNQRRQFIAEHPNCWVCGANGTQCHEMVGPRATAIHHRETYLALCSVNGNCCHEEVHRSWPLAKQAALKLVCDPEHFSLAKLCEIKGRAPTFVTLSEVAEYLLFVSSK